MQFEETIIPFLQYKKDYIKASSISNYEAIFNVHLVPFFKGCTTITQQKVDEYLLKKCNESLAKKTLESHVTALKSLTNWGNRTGLFKAKPFRANYPSAATEKAEAQPLSIEESKSLAKYCEENFSFENLAIYTVLFTGLRAGEICGLQFKDIDLEKGVLTVNKTVSRISFGMMATDVNATGIIIDNPKTENSIREIPLAKQLIKYYKPLLKIVNPEFYVATNKPTPYEPSMLRNILSRIIETINLPKIKFHDLRHTFATRCISAGIDPKTVSVILGHSSVLTTLKTYMHTDDLAKIEAMNKLNKKMAW